MACTGTRTDYDVVIFVVDAVYVALRVCRRKRPHVSSAADVSSKKARETVWGEEQMCLLYTHAASFRRPSYGIPDCDRSNPPLRQRGAPIRRRSRRRFGERTGAIRNMVYGHRWREASSASMHGVDRVGAPSVLQAPSVGLKADLVLDHLVNLMVGTVLSSSGRKGRTAL